MALHEVFKAERGSFQSEESPQSRWGAWARLCRKAVVPHKEPQQSSAGEKHLMEDLAFLGWWESDALSVQHMNTFLHLCLCSV